MKKPWVQWAIDGRYDLVMLRILFWQSILTACGMGAVYYVEDQFSLWDLWTGMLLGYLIGSTKELIWIMKRERDRDV